MELTTLLLPEKTVVFPYPGLDGLEFELAFLSKESNQKIYNKCLVKTFNSKYGTSEKLDDDKFLELYVREVVRGWKGFKMKYLSEFVLADFSDYDDEDEMDYTPENALALMKSSTVFDNWVSEVISDLKNFTTPKTKSVKKSKSSKDTSKSPAQE